MVGACDIITDGFRGHPAKEHRAGMADLLEQCLGLVGGDLDVFGGERIGQRRGLVKARDFNDHAVRVPAFCRHPRARQHGEFDADAVGDGVGEQGIVGYQD